MNLQEKLPKAWRRKRWFWGLIGAVLLVVIIVIVVPIAVIFSRKNHKTTYGAMLIVPLYIYPTTASTWQPLYDAVETRSSLNFTVVVNPASGPGTDMVPDEQYYSAIQKLNSYSNVQTVGYVRTGYATRDIDTVIEEVKTYAGWSSNSSSIAMSGIFFDESPHEYSDSAVEYMKNISSTVKGADGLFGDKTVIRNPGTVPDNRYNDDNVDIIVVFEDNYDAWQSRSADVSAAPDSRAEKSIMINSVPSMSDEDMKNFVNDVASVGEHLFLTSNDANFYESWASDWSNFVDATQSTN
ncbi:hypothetical protein G7054_g7336 [Neopestalotiopsis clavispora]|nr:hypothetical protein G7054_g7336 [Neopestalotiopsis clavispora]